MSILQKDNVYRCPQGHYEASAERAMAWHLSAMLGRPDEYGKADEVSFSNCWAIVKRRRDVIAMLNELDSKEAA